MTFSSTTYAHAIVTYNLFFSLYTYSCHYHGLMICKNFTTTEALQHYNIDYSSI